MKLQATLAFKSGKQPVSLSYQTLDYLKPSKPNAYTRQAILAVLYNATAQSLLQRIARINSCTCTGIRARAYVQGQKPLFSPCTAATTVALEVARLHMSTRHLHSHAAEEPCDQAQPEQPHHAARQAVLVQTLVSSKLRAQAQVMLATPAAQCLPGKGSLDPAHLLPATLLALHLYSSSPQAPLPAYDSLAAHQGLAGDSINSEEGWEEQGHRWKGGHQQGGGQQQGGIQHKATDSAGHLVHALQRAHARSLAEQVMRESVRARQQAEQLLMGKQEQQQAIK